ncbi:DUF4190 domain-containing protein [Candidatus Saccharibacteria bacterium]|nr:DUF4190 domain-containing protein [Candidatus Saccharibacteria bacterium]
MSNQKQPNNTAALLGVCFAFILSPLGLVLSIVGLIQSKKMNGRRRTMAAVGIALNAVILIYGIAQIRMRTDLF